MGLSFDKVNCTLFAQILIAQIFAKLKNNKKIFKNRNYLIPFPHLQLYFLNFPIVGHSSPENQMH